jgi:uncharacterized Zn finger protein
VPYLQSAGFPGDQALKGLAISHWWGRRWLETLDTLDDWGRLRRGRSYARSGHVSHLDAGPRGVSAWVQGGYSNRYEVRLRLQHFPDDVWERVFDRLGAEARYSAALLAGVLPEETDEFFNEAGASLFPTDMDELTGHCSCPDWTRPCKHIAAVCYLVGERIDADPLLLFELRGISRDRVLDALRARRRALAPSPSPDEAEHDQAEAEAETAVDAAEFWRAGPALDSLAFSFAAPSTHAVPAKQLGVPPAWYERRDFITWMEKSYEVVSAHAARLAARTGARARRDGAGSG